MKGLRTFCPPCRQVVDRLPDTDCAWTRQLPTPVREDREERIAHHTRRVLSECVRLGLVAATAAVKGGAA